MKKVIFGGFVFLGGSIVYAFSVSAAFLGQGIFPLESQYVGLTAMVAGVVLGVMGIRSDK